MKQGTNPRRSRGRNNNNSSSNGGSGGNNSGGNPNNNGGARRSSRNQNYESNGPDVKVRGTAQQVLDKYLQLARDSQSGGDRVKAEAYLQFAEHYYRIVNADAENDQARTVRQGDGGEQPDARHDARQDAHQAAPQESSQHPPQPQHNRVERSEASSDHNGDRHNGNRQGGDRQREEAPVRERSAGEGVGRGRVRPVPIKNEATLAAEAAAANEAALKAAAQAPSQTAPQTVMAPAPAELPLMAPVKVPVKPRTRRVKPVDADVETNVENKAIPA